MTPRYQPRRPPLHLGLMNATLCWGDVSKASTSTAYIEPGSLWESGFAESFNCQFRDELVNTDLFTTAPEAQILADRWSTHELSTLRPHSTLQGLTHDHDHPLS